jgi:hypothetical protein
MRRLLIVCVLAACGHSSASGPKWPEASVKEEDGGESLEPRPSATYAAAVEKSEDDKDDKPAAASSDETPEAPESDDKPATTSAPTQPANDDVITTEEIIIEIED